MEFNMQNLTMKQVDVFTTKPFGGNPAGVFFNAEGLTIESMRKIAGNMYFCETTFVTKSGSKDATYRIRFFYPNGEANLSGHAMIATCFALAEEGMVQLDHGQTQIYFETNIGNVPVNYYFNKDHTSEISENDKNRIALIVDGNKTGALEKIMLNQIIKGYRPTDIPVGDISKILGIDEKEISGTGLPLEIVSNGLTQLIVPVLHKKTVINMQPDLIRLRLMNQKYEIQTSDVFTLDSLDSYCITYSRHFSPVMGLWEDPASGAGAASIATYLLRHGVITPGTVIMEQGKDVDNLARVFVDIDKTNGEWDSVWVGGLAVTSITREVDVENGEIL